MLTAVLWLIINIYNALISPTDVAVDAVVKTPINPAFDEEVYRSIIGREDLNTLVFVASESASPVSINEVSIPTEEVESEVESEELTTE
jgi:hypothetical protein